MKHWLSIDLSPKKDFDGCAKLNNRPAKCPSLFMPLLVQCTRYNCSYNLYHKYLSLMELKGICIWPDAIMNDQILAEVLGFSHLCSIK